MAVQAVIAEGPLYCGFTGFNRAEVSFEGGRAVAIMHTALDHEWLSRELTDPILIQKRDLLPRTLELRRAHLMAYVQDKLSAALANEEVSDSIVADALSAAFDRMNQQMMETMPDVNELPDASWLSQYNALVVVVEGARVFVAGDAWTQAMLVRKGEQKELTQLLLSVSITVARRSRSVKRATTPLCFFNRENLTKDDEYLVIYSEAVMNLVEAHNLPGVLQTRAKYFGLEAACGQIVDSSLHDPPRLLVVLPLDVGEETISDTGLAVEELERYGVIGLIDEGSLGATFWDNVEDDTNSGSVSSRKIETNNDYAEEEEEEEYDPYDDYDGRLQPLTVKPEDTEWRSNGLTSTRLVSLHRVVCKFESSTLVISMGDITKWSYDGKNDAVVVPIGGTLEGRMRRVKSLAKGVIYNRWRPGVDALADGYRAAADLAEGGVKYIAFPAVGCGRDRLSASEAATPGVRTMFKCGGKFEEVHFVLPDKETWSAWVAATDLLSYAYMVDIRKRMDEDNREWARSKEHRKASGSDSSAHLSHR